MLTAITRDVNTAINSGELTFLTRASIDTGLALQQHRHYENALLSLGCELVSMPTEPGLSDSVFIEDTAIVLDEIAVMCRPGATSRRPEVAAVKTVLRNYRKLATIEPPGTLDGGDLLRVGKRIYAGQSSRSNAHGIGQLRSIIAPFGYSVSVVETAKCLHLKSAVSEIAAGKLLINPDWINRAAFEEHELIEVDPREAHAANALLVGSGLIYPGSFPRTLEKMADLDTRLVTVDVSELQKAEGAVTCCSLILN